MPPFIFTVPPCGFPEGQGLHGPFHAPSVACTPQVPCEHSAPTPTSCPLPCPQEHAFESSQKYKEGKFIIELAHMIKDNGWE